MPVLVDLMRASARCRTWMLSLTILKTTGLLRCCWIVSSLTGPQRRALDSRTYTSLLRHGLVKHNQQLESPLDRRIGIRRRHAVHDRAYLERIRQHSNLRDRLGNLSLEGIICKGPEMLSQQPRRQLLTVPRERRLLLVVVRDKVLVGDPSEDVADCLQVCTLQC